MSGSNVDRLPAPELALVGAGCGLVEVSADMVSVGTMQWMVWLRGPGAVRYMETGFWVRLGLAGPADVYFAPRGVLFNRARFEATQVLLASDPAPRLPDVWLLRSKPPGPGCEAPV